MEKEEITHPTLGKIQGDKVAYTISGWINDPRTATKEDPCRPSIVDSLPPWVKWEVHGNEIRIVADSTVHASVALSEEEVVKNG